MSKYNLLLSTKLVRVWAKRYPRIALGVLGGVLALGFLCVYVWQNTQATDALQRAGKLDKSGNYTKAQQDLRSINTLLVTSATKRGIANELRRSQQLEDTQHKLAEVKKLLQEHKTAEAQTLLQTIQGSTSSGSSPSSTQQIAALQNTIKQQSNTASSHSPTAGSGSTGGSGGGQGGSTGGGTSGGSSGQSPPPPGPMTSLAIVSFSANATPATASTCSIQDSVTFSANGTGQVSTTWSLFSTKTTSETVNPNTFTFSAPGNQSDSFSFNGTQGLEPGDNYRLSVTITSTSNPSVTVTTSPVYISSCAAPPSLATEQYSPFMSAITPGTPSVYEYQDGIFSNECSVQVTTPYSVNSSGTVEAIVQVTSASSIGYTYYNTNGAQGFSGPGSGNDTAYFRLPHLPGGGRYNIAVKLVEVSSPGTVYTTTSSVSSACD